MVNMVVEWKPCSRQIGHNKSVYVQFFFINRNGWICSVHEDFFDSLYRFCASPQNRLYKQVFIKQGSADIYYLDCLLFFYNHSASLSNSGFSKRLPMTSQWESLPWLFTTNPHLELSSNWLVKPVSLASHISLPTPPKSVSLRKSPSYISRPDLSWKPVNCIRIKSRPPLA